MPDVRKGRREKNNYICIDTILFGHSFDTMLSDNFEQLSIKL
jgi:hypothetical protein